MDIYKYELRNSSETSFTWSKESEILDFKYINGIPTIWVLHGEEFLFPTDYTFIVVPTGNSVLDTDEFKNYVGTDISDGWYVGHCFYKTF